MTATVKPLAIVLIAPLSFLLVLTGCAEDEATGQEILEALCARRDVCSKTSVKDDCVKTYRISGCPDGTWDGKKAYQCVQALASADCAQVTMNPVPVVPEVCRSHCGGYGAVFSAARMGPP